MDYFRFLVELPIHFKDWEQGVISPGSEMFQAIINQTGEQTHPSVLQTLNLAVGCLNETEVYCQIGCQQGALLAGAMQQHPTCLSYVVEAAPLPALAKTLANFGLDEQVFVFSQGFACFFADLKQLEAVDRIGVYVYDGPHDYRSQLMGLLLVKPWLADQALILSSCGGAESATQATQDFVSTHAASQQLIHLSDGAQVDWQILRWDTTTNAPTHLHPNRVNLPRVTDAPISQEFWQTKTYERHVLHVGCGPYHPQGLHSIFRAAPWREIRLDVDPAVQPDLIGSMTDLSSISGATLDAVWSSHNIEHLYDHEVPLALGEFHRILKPEGFVLMTLPDIQKIAEYVAQGRWEDPLYQSSMGPISALDVVYGHRPSLIQGNYYMAHKTGFTAPSLGQKLLAAGFAAVEVVRDNINLWAIAYKQGSFAGRLTLAGMGITGEERLLFGQ